MHIDDKIWTTLFMLLINDELNKLKDDKIEIRPEEVDIAEKMGNEVRKYD